MGGGKGGGSNPQTSYAPMYTSLLEDMLTGQALGAVFKNNPNAGAMLKNYAGQGFISQNPYSSRGGGGKGGGPQYNLPDFYSKSPQLSNALGGLAGLAKTPYSPQRTQQANQIMTQNFGPPISGGNLYGGKPGFQNPLYGGWK